MNFKDFYNLKEERSSYPLWYDLDEGGRLIYYITIRRFGKISSIQHLERNSVKYVNITSAIDGDNPMDFWVINTRDEKSFDKMLGRLEHAMIPEWWSRGISDDSGIDDDPTKDEALAEFSEIVEPLRNVQGKWYIVGEDIDDIVTLHICVEIDPVFIRSYNINKSLRDVDTTGFEDLL
jgi:hypothetical protein